MEDDVTKPIQSYPSLMGSHGLSQEDEAWGTNSCGGAELMVEFNWYKLWLGFFIESVMLPPCLLYTFICPYVEWGGIIYKKQDGKVTQLEAKAVGAGQNGMVLKFLGNLSCFCEGDKGKNK
jgi:hypothetical protein